MDKILLHDQEYQLGVDVAISIGLNMQCKKIITKSVINKDVTGFFCRNCGVNIRLTDDDLMKFYTNTPENRKILKSQMK